MKQKIKEALQQEYKNLGLNDEAFEGVATFGETLGINEESLANFVKGAKDLLKREQSNADKFRSANANSNKQIEELKAKLAEVEANLKAPKDEPKEDIGKLLDEKLNALVNPLLERINTFENAKTAENAFKSAKELFFGNDYAKKYTDERDIAWERAVEINEATGSKMTAEELQTKAMGYFNSLVSKKGVDTSKPFESEGSGKTLDFEDDVKILEKEGLLKKN